MLFNKVQLFFEIVNSLISIIITAIMKICINSYCYIICLLCIGFTSTLIVQPKSINNWVLLLFLSLIAISFSISFMIGLYNITPSNYKRKILLFYLFHVYYLIFLGCTDKNARCHLLDNLNNFKLKFNGGFSYIHDICYSVLVLMIVWSINSLTHDFAICAISLSLLSFYDFPFLFNIIKRNFKLHGKLIMSEILLTSSENALKTSCYSVIIFIAFFLYSFPLYLTVLYSSILFIFFFFSSFFSFIFLYLLLPLTHSFLYGLTEPLENMFKSELKDPVHISDKNGTF